MARQVVAVSAGIDTRKNRGTGLPRARISLRHPGSRHGQVKIAACRLLDESLQLGTAESFVPVLTRPGRVTFAGTRVECRGQNRGFRLCLMQRAACGDDDHCNAAEAKAELAHS